MEVESQSIEYYPWDDKPMIAANYDLDNSQLLDLIGHNHKRVLRNKDKFLRKIRSYLESIQKSEGFECINFPGHIQGLTTVEPRDEILIGEHRSFVASLSQEAIEVYNRQNETKFNFSRIISVNSLSPNDSSTYYYITFTVMDYKDYVEVTFQAKVFYKMFDFEVVFCRPNT